MSYQPGAEEIEFQENFQDTLNRFLREKDISLRELARQTGISRATINRFSCGFNGKEANRGKTYLPKTADVLKISIALKLTPEEKDYLLILTNPSLYYADYFLQRGKTPMEVDDFLAQKGFPLLFSDEDDEGMID